MNTNPSSRIKDKNLYDSFVNEYRHFMKNYQIDGQKSATGTRSPLQFALMISPLYLLMTWRLSSKSFHRRTLLDAASRLGPNKPLLLEVLIVDCCESPLWWSLLQLLWLWLSWQSLGGHKGDPNLKSITNHVIG